MSPSVPFVCWLSLTISPSAMKLLHISHCFLWLLALPNFHSILMELLHVSHCILW